MTSVTDDTTNELWLPVRYSLATGVVKVETSRRDGNTGQDMHPCLSP